VGVITDGGGVSLIYADTGHDTVSLIYVKLVCVLAVVLVVGMDTG